MTSYHSGDAKLLPQFDLGECSLPVQPGRSYTLGTWYQSTAATQYSVYYRTWSGRWVYWTSSPYFPASPGWAQARWATPPRAGGRTGLSFGLALFSNGSLTTDSYSFAATPPNVARLIIGLGPARRRGRSRPGGRGAGGAAPLAAAPGLSRCRSSGKWLSSSSSSR